MGVYKVFDGTNWVDPCVCDIRIRTSDDDWKLLEPADCITKYFNGSTWCVLDCATPQITENTEINIWFDSSGSMKLTKPALEAMRDDVLAPCLLPFYGGNQVLYDERVRFFEQDNERSIDQIGTLRNFSPAEMPDGLNPRPYPNPRVIDTNVDLVLNIVFSDEANNGYWISMGGPNPFDPNAALRPDYVTDIPLARSATLEPYTVKGTMMRVEGNIGQRQFIEALFTDVGLYSPPNNLSDLQLRYNASLDILRGFYLFTSNLNTYKVINQVDWLVGEYEAAVDYSGIVGAGLGMTMYIDVEQVTGIDTFTVSNVGLGYTPNQPSLGLTLTSITNPGLKASVTAVTSPAGSILSAVVNVNGEIYTPGEVYQLTENGVTPTIIAEVTINSVINYNRADNLTPIRYDIVTAGTGYVSATNVPTSAPYGQNGMTVDIIAVAGVITEISLNTFGFLYIEGDEITVNQIGSGLDSVIEIIRITPFYGNLQIPPAEYGNGLYLFGESVELTPPVGSGGIIPATMSIGFWLGTPQYYAAETVSALNQLGLVLTCP